MNVQSFCLFTLPNDIIDFTFYNLVVGFAADFFQFETSAMITRHDFIVNKPPEMIKEKKKFYFTNFSCGYTILPPWFLNSRNDTSSYTMHKLAQRVLNRWRKN